MINKILSGLDAFFANADVENKDGVVVITCNAEYEPIYWTQLLLHNINEKVVDEYKQILYRDNNNPDVIHTEEANTLLAISLMDADSFENAIVNMVTIQSISTSKGVVTITTNVPYETFRDEARAWNDVIIAKDSK